MHEMRAHLRTFLSVWRLTAAAAIVVIAGAGASASAAPQPPQTTPSRPALPRAVNPQAAALQDFTQRLDAYLKLRATLSNTLTSQSSGSTASELTTSQNALAAAIIAARKNARPGDLIPAVVANQIRTTVVTDLAGRSAAAQRAALEDGPDGARLAINQLYPMTASRATVPPVLLHNLPRLPDNLQYRFYDRHIVLLDGDTELVLDYILNALPALAGNDPEHH